jgi:hypothetical protein
MLRMFHQLLLLSLMLLFLSHRTSPPLTVAVGLFDIVTCEVAVPVHGAVPKLYVIVYVLGADAPRSIAPVAASITSPAGNARMYHL